MQQRNPDVLKEYEKEITSRAQTLKMRAGLLEEIREEGKGALDKFNLPLEDTKENILKARQKNIKQMRKEIKFLEDKLFNYELVIEARQKELGGEEE